MLSGSSFTEHGDVVQLYQYSVAQFASQLVRPFFPPNRTNGSGARGCVQLWGILTLGLGL